MKLYVWEGVFADYTSGMAVALAPTRQEAVDAIARDMGWCNISIACESGHKLNTPKCVCYVCCELKTEPQIYNVNRKTAIGFQISGGG